MKCNIPDKLYFKIGEVAKLAEVPTHVLRYWETEFRNIKPKRANSKQRLYRREDVELILKIKVMLHNQGYTIAGARKLIENGEDVPEAVVYNNHPTPRAKPDMTDALGAIKSQLLQLQQFICKRE